MPLSSDTIVVDALLGTGVRGAVQGRLRDVIAGINGREAGCTVVSVDIPSGLHADTGEVQGAAVIADYTITFTAPKPGMVSGEGGQHVGQLIVRQIGSPSALIEETGKGDASLERGGGIRRVRDSTQGCGQQRRLRPRSGRCRLGGQERRGGAFVLGGAESGSGISHCGDARTCAPDHRRAHARNYDRAACRDQRGTISARCLDGTLFADSTEGEARPGYRSGALNASQRRNNLFAPCSAIAPCRSSSMRTASTLSRVGRRN